MSVSIGAAYLADARKRFEEARSQAERALAQLPYERWGDRLDPGSNSLVTLMLHVSGQPASRAGATSSRATARSPTATATPSSRTRASRATSCSRGGSAAGGRSSRRIDALGEDDLVRTVTIRGEPHTVVQAINRQIAHYALHVGQMLFLAKHLAGAAWRHQSLPRRGRRT